ncbi:MAG: hypothetical protein QXS81_04950 [Candidatus Micrarchaeaceae archaeon]
MIMGVGIVVLILVAFSVAEFFAPGIQIRRRFRSLFGAFIFSIFLNLTEAIAALPTPTLSSLMIALLGMIFGAVYFYEGLTLWWVYPLLQLFKNKHSKRKELRRVK